MCRNLREKAWRRRRNHEIQKVSNLILNLNVYIKDVNGDKPERGYSVDMRGDTDESFDRAVKYIVKHNILGK